ncbi:MAG TPA: molybdopterin cofactor-binding domain-containing protein, partial [Burkholderiales bacterium]
MPLSHRPSRRDFLKVSTALGAGLALELKVPDALAAEPKGPELTAWIVIRPNDEVIIRVARSEMGQGSSTGLAMLVAEELDCDWKKVRTEFVSTGEQLRRNRVWGSMATGGSQSIRSSHEYLRRAGATARAMLVAAAAKRWDLPEAECLAEIGTVTHLPSRRKLRYGDVAQAASKLEPPKDVPLKDPRVWRLAGKPTPRLDIPDKVTGKPLFGIDVQLPGMCYAAIAQCPVFRGKVVAIADERIKGMRGLIKVVRLEDAVAVVADNWWRANKILKALPIEWDAGQNGNASTDSIREFVRAGLDDARAPVARNEGNVEAALDSAAKIVESEYYAPFLNHAPLEPMNCTALVKGDRVEVWAPTQNAEATHAIAAVTAGVPQENVNVHL